MTPCFVLTNDPDHATTEHTGRVFELLNRYGIKVTTAVFNVLKESDCWLGAHCRPGETASLADPEFRRLLLEQKGRGHEIAYHGYCQVGETREEFRAGLEEFRALFGEYPYTYIEHGPNPNTHPGYQCRPNTLTAEGGREGSPHYIADLLRERCRLVWTQEDLLGTHHLTDPTGPVVREPVGFFRRLDDGLVHFHRYRLYLFQHEPFFRRLWDARASFVGYTHFGYPYPGEWGRWGSERWDDLEGLSREFWAWVSRTGYRFKTLREFHLEAAGGGDAPRGSAAPEGMSRDHEENETGDGPPGSSVSVSIPQGVSGKSLPDPLETLELGIPSAWMSVDERALEPVEQLIWGMNVQVLAKLLADCRSVLCIGDTDGRVLLPLAKKFGFRLTLVGPYTGVEARDWDHLWNNLRLLKLAPRCAVRRIPFAEFRPDQRYDGVVSLGLAMDQGPTPEGEARTCDLLTKAYELADRVIAVELSKPVEGDGFQAVQTLRESYLSWALKEPAPPLPAGPGRAGRVPLAVTR